MIHSAASWRLNVLYMFLSIFATRNFFKSIFYLFTLRQMHVQLRKRNGNACLVQGIFTAFRNTPFTFPVISIIQPTTHTQIHTACSQFIYKYTHFHILFDCAVFFQNLLQHFLCLLDIGIIGYAYDNIKSAMFFGGYINKTVVC